jgi:hypothetical protein
MSATASDLIAFAARYGNKIIQEQVALKCPLWSELDHIPGQGQAGIVNIDLPAQVSGGFVQDGAARNAGVSTTPVQGYVKPSFLQVPLKLNNGALMTLSGKDDSANYLDAQLKKAGNTAAKLIGQGLFSDAGKICDITTGASFSGGRASIVVPSAAGLATGMPVTLRDDSATRAFILRVGAITLSATDATATVELIADVTVRSDQSNNVTVSGITITSSDDLYAVGFLTNEGVDAACAASNTDMVTLDVLSGTGSVYGISANDCSANGFAGQTFTSVGDPTQEALIARANRIYNMCGDKPDLVVVNPLTASVLGFAGITAKAGLGAGFSSTDVGNSRKMIDANFDKYGKGIVEGEVRIGGMKVLSDQNCRESEAYLLNKDYLKVMKWQDIQPEKQGGESIFVDQGNFAKVAFFSAAFNLYCNKRSTIGKLEGLTSDFM